MNLSALHPRYKFLLVILSYYAVAWLYLSWGSGLPYSSTLPTAFRPLYDTTAVATVRGLLLAQIDTMTTTRLVIDSARKVLLARQVAQLYAFHNFRPIWYPAGIRLPKTDTLLQRLQQHPQDGLLRACYYTDSIQFLQQYIDTIKVPQQRLKALVKLDFLTTLSFLTYVTHLRYGKITIAKGRYSLSKWQQYRTSQDSVALTAYRELYRGGISQTLQHFTPIHPQYLALQQALRYYMDMGKKTFLPIDATSSTLQLHDSSQTVKALKQYLVALGDLPASKVHDEMVFDSATYWAVRRFQYRHHLLLNGQAEKNTLALLQQPIHTIIESIALNMERLRWREYAPAPRSLVVNIPDFRVYMYEKDRVVSVMKVIVGKKTTPTPIFTDTLEYVIFRPTWSVPDKIAINEILPKMRTNARYLAANDYVLYDRSTQKRVNLSSADLKNLSAKNFRYQIVQRSGDNNALGYVKFIFPNQANVYLHDTPTDNLFNKARRALSHGCVRLECPEQLAVYVLQAIPSWDKEKIMKAMTDKQQKVVTLPIDQRIPVQLWYQTVWVDTAGMLHFAEDIYEHDTEQLRWLLN